MEKQLFPSDDLKPAHDRIVWLYVYNDFSKNEADRAADRIRARFSVTSWPQHILVDPASMDVIGDTGRSAQSFLAAVQQAVPKVVKAKKSKEINDALKAAEETAAKLQGEPDIEDAKKGLDHADPVVKTLAITALSRKEPAALLGRVKELLDNRNDQIRFPLCVMLAALPDDVEVPAGVAEKLRALLEKPEGSRNPNMLRSHCAGALGRIGAKPDLEALASVVKAADYLNGLTHSAIKAVGAIAVRHDGLHTRAMEILQDGVPKVPTDQYLRNAAYVAKRVYETARIIAPELEPAFPETWTEETRAAVVQRLADWLAQRKKEGLPDNASPPKTDGGPD